jgi:hypothetical protein
MRALMSRVNGRMLAVYFGVLAAVGTAIPSYAQGPDFTGSVTAAIATVSTQLQTIVPAALLVGAAMVALRIGWRTAKRFVGG